MTRPVRSDIIIADGAARRFVEDQREAYIRLGYPRQSAFAKLVARGTCPTPTPTDPIVEQVGRFFWTRGQVERSILVDRYSGDSQYIQARRHSMSVRQLQIRTERLLTTLMGWLEATGFAPHTPASEPTKLVMPAPRTEAREALLHAE